MKFLRDDCIERGFKQNSIFSLPSIKKDGEKRNPKCLKNKVVQIAQD